MKPYDIEQVGEGVRLGIGYNTTVMSAQGALDMAMELLTAGRAAMSVENKRKIAELEQALNAAKADAYEAVTP